MRKSNPGISAPQGFPEQMQDRHRLWAANLWLEGRGLRRPPGVNDSKTVSPASFFPTLAGCPDIFCFCWMITPDWTSLGAQMMNVVSRRMVSRGNTSNVTVTLFDPLVQPPGIRSAATKGWKGAEKHREGGISSDSGGSFQKESSDERENRLFDLLWGFDWNLLDPS